MTKRHLATALVALAALAGITVILAILAYTVQNDSGHTGMNPYHALVVFVPAAAAGLLHLVFLRSGMAARCCAILAVVAGIAGVGLLVYLDRSNTLLEYNRWIERGMP